MAQINVVPYIDVMLVLLIIFMVTAPLMQLGVEINLPTAQKPNPLTTPSKDKLPIIVGVDANGSYHLEVSGHVQSGLTLQEIEQEVAEQLQADASQQIYVEGDKNANYGSVAELLVTLQSAGAKNIGFNMSPEPKRKGR
jgi:biopolymer transport protein TolR